MGEVFAAENIRTGRPVAVKLLRSDSKQKSSAVARFRREARAAGSINSDHVTQVLDVDEDQEHGIVLVFELLEGESLIDRLKRTGPISFEELHPIIEQVWMGLADAHRAGIIHRDLKPSNVFLERRPDGSVRVKILDFGISKLPKEMGGETLTEMGQSLGTFSFMPPEQIGKAKTVDHRADIYACATLIYQALTGQLPYSARNILVMVEMKTKSDARKLADAVGGPIDPRLEGFLSKGLARDPGQRFQTSVDALNAWRELRPPNAVPPNRGERPPTGNFQAVPGGMTTPGPDGFSRAPIAQPATMPSVAADGSIEQVAPIAEMTTDSAATLAIPAQSNPVAANAFPSQPAGAIPTPRQANRPMRTNSPIPARPIGLGGTIHMPAGPPRPTVVERAPGDKPSEPARPISRPNEQARQGDSQSPGAYRPDSPMSYAGEGTGGFRQEASQGGGWDEASVQAGNLPPHPAGYYIPPAVAASLPMRQPRLNADIPVRGFDDPTSVPVSSEQTRIYKPNRDRNRDGDRDSSLVPAGLEKRSAMPYILGAIVFGLVGFGIGAALLYYFGSFGHH